jgi:hypothetical protein
MAYPLAIKKRELGAPLSENFKVGPLPSIPIFTRNATEKFYPQSPAKK